MFQKNFLQTVCLGGSNTLGEQCGPSWKHCQQTTYSLQHEQKKYFFNIFRGK